MELPAHSLQSGIQCGKLCLKTQVHLPQLCVGFVPDATGVKPLTFTFRTRGKDSGVT